MIHSDLYETYQNNLFDVRLRCQETLAAVNKVVVLDLHGVVDEDELEQLQEAHALLLKVRKLLA